MAIGEDDGRVIHRITPVPIHLDRDRLLICDFAALLILEERLGIEALDADAINKCYESKSARTHVTMLWALLLRDDPSLTIEDAARLIGYPGYGEVRTAILRAFVAGLPELPGEAEETEAGADAPGELVPVGATGE